jgi:hypothetical protein
VRGFFSETGPLRDDGTFTPEKRNDFKMKLYHFTASEYIEPIMTHGLNRGEVVIDAPNLVQNGVNLTTDADPRDHGLSDGRLVTSRERRLFEQMHGVRLPEGGRFPNKRRVRIEINLAEHTHGLVNWLQWSATHVDRATREGLIRTGGGIVKASTWYVSFPPIPPSALICIGIRNHAGSYMPCQNRTEVQQAIMALKLPGVRLASTATNGDGKAS